MIGNLKLDELLFKEPLLLFYTADNKVLSYEVSSMADLMGLISQINDNGWTAGVGTISLEFQLWFALAWRSNFFISSN